MSKCDLGNVLLKHNSVVDCHISNLLSGGSEVVAYVVVRGRLDERALNDHLQAEMGDSSHLDFIPVARIPRTDEGVIDIEALEHIRTARINVPISWEHELVAHPEIHYAAVLLEDTEPDMSRLHLADRLPEWKRSMSSHQDASGGESPQSVLETPSGRNAIAHGPQLLLSDDAPVTLPGALKRCAALYPSHGITYIQNDGTDRFQRYPELMDEAQRLLGGLRKFKLTPQSKIILQLNDNEDFIPAFWACLLGGFVPVPIATAPVYEPGNAVVERLLNAWRHLSYPIVLTNDEIAGQLNDLEMRLGLEAFRLATIRSLKGAPIADDWSENKTDELAILLFTSGSTGTPKGVMLSHQNILSNVAASAQVNDFGPADISLNWLRLDHVGSLVRCSIRDIYVGSNQVHAPVELVLESPTRLLDWIEQYAVTFAWAPNFALGLINKELQMTSGRHWNLSALRSMLSVAEAINPQTAQTFVRLLAPYGFSEPMMHAAWGMSETCAAVTFSHNYLEHLPHDAYPYVEVGAPTAGFSKRIVDNNDQVITEETVGRLQIKGPMILSGYYENPELNASEFTEDGWFKTGDLGYIKQGRLTVTGREKDIIIINGQNHFSPEIEAIVEDVDGVLPSYTAACGLRKEGRDTDQLLVFFCSERSESKELKVQLKAIQSNIARKLSVHADYLLPVETSLIPKSSAGKIQRVTLKQRFDEGCFFERIKEIDLLLENQNTMPDWFYQPRWERHEVTLEVPLAKSGRVLVFLDEVGLGEKLMQRLSREGYECVGVIPSQDFAQIGSDRISMNPSDETHYQQLLDATCASGLPNIILHCWLYQSSVSNIETILDIEKAQERGAYFLLHLVQALKHRADANQIPIRIQTVSSFGQLVHEKETELDFAKSPILGLIKTIPRELPWADCRHLDLSTEDLDGNLRSILREMRVPQMEREVAYRGGQRFVSRIKAIDWVPQPPAPYPFRKDRFYLITGGLGGIGFEITKYLLKHHQVNLVLIGRSSLEQVSSAGGREAGERSFSELRTLGGGVAYVSADVTDQNAMELLVKEQSQKWNSELGGILHLAGAAPERLLQDETVESLTETFRAKVFGTWVLHQLIKDDPDGLFVSMSSVISLFGGASVGAYAASNMFQNHFQRHAIKNGHDQHYCFRSSTWSQVGVNQGSKAQEVRRTQGQISMSVRQALHSVFIGLSHQLNDMIFGLDRTKSSVYELCADVEIWRQRPVAYVQSALGDKELSRLRPNGERLVRSRVERVGRMPLDKNGLVDRSQLKHLVMGLGDKGSPNTPTEKKLERIWKEVLGLSQVARDDSFFELGGTSVLAAQLFNEIECETGKALPLASLFQASTIAQLAVLLEKDSVDSDLWASLVPIRVDGDKHPVFLIHAGLGDVIGYEGLVRYLDPDRPAYALRPIDFSGLHEPFRTIEAMASHYISEIFRHHPCGPYSLIGQCTGGVVAFEMAQQLTALGHEVEFVGMLDTSFPQYKNYLKPRFQYYTQPPTYKDGKWDVWYYVSVLISHVRPYGVKASLNRRIKVIRDGVRSCLGKNTVRREEFAASQQFAVNEANDTSVTQIADSDGIDASRYYMEERFFESFLRAQQRYKPRSYAGKIDFFLTTQNTFTATMKPYSLGSFRQTIPVESETSLRLGWDRLCAGGLTVHPLEVKHEDMTTEPYVQLLGEKLNQLLYDLET